MSRNIQAPKWFLIIASVAVVWNVLGIFAYFSTVLMSAEEFAKMPQAMQDLQKATPIWATIAFAIAVFMGTIGSLLLVIKKSLALPILVLSLLAVIVQMYNFIFLMNGIAIITQPERIMTILVIVVAFLLVFLAKHAKTKAWISY